MHLHFSKFSFSIKLGILQLLYFSLVFFLHFQNFLILGRVFLGVEGNTVIVAFELCVLGCEGFQLRPHHIHFLGLFYNRVFVGVSQNLEFP